MARSILQDIKDVAALNSEPRPLNGEALRTKIMAERAKKAAARAKLAPRMRQKRGKK